MARGGDGGTSQEERNSLVISCFLFQGQNNSALSQACISNWKHSQTSAKISPSTVLPYYILYCVLSVDRKLMASFVLQYNQVLHWQKVYCVQHQILRLLAVNSSPMSSNAQGVDNSEVTYSIILFRNDHQGVVTVLREKPKQHTTFQSSMIPRSLQLTRSGPVRHQSLGLRWLLLLLHTEPSSSPLRTSVHATSLARQKKTSRLVTSRLNTNLPHENNNRAKIVLKWASNASCCVWYSTRWAC